MHIKKGVRQGCVLSPLLYNLYSERVMEEALENVEEGIKVNGININNIRYADDTVLLASSEQGLQKLFNRVITASEKSKLKINNKKTVAMVFAKNNDNNNNNIHLLCKDIKIKQVDSFKYLGETMCVNNNQTQKVKIKIARAKSVFYKLKKFLTNSRINKGVRVRFLKCFVWPIVLYCCEALTITADVVDKLNAFEMWCYRKMLNIKWSDYRSNDKVLRLIGINQKQLVQILKKRKLSYFGHFMRSDKYHVQRLVLMGKLESQRQRGRRRMSWLDNVKQWTNLNLMQLNSIVQLKQNWKNVVANVS